MRKITPYLTVNLVGLVYALAMGGISSGLAFFTVRDNPGLQRLFAVSLGIEVLAALLFAPGLIREALVSPENCPSRPTKRHLPSILHVSSLLLAVVTTAYLYRIGQDFLATMAFVVYPSALLILACASAILGCLAKWSKAD